MKRIIILLFVGICLPAVAQEVPGCLDIEASNYNSSATISDFSCSYEFVSINLEADQSFLLPYYLNESSALCSYNNLLWTHNDDHTSKIFGIDKSNGRVVDSIDFGLNIFDWEETHYFNGKFYIGDFGNNGTGVRSDLRVFRYDVNTQIVDTIQFNYFNQFDFNVVAANQTNFDCEAFLVTDSMIYLFTKRWSDYNTELHKLPNRSGYHTTELVGNYNCEGLITGSTFSSDGITLVGYTTLLSPFLIVLKDYESDHFLESNKRKYQLNLPFHQVEAITYEEGSNAYSITNEQFSIFGQIIPAKLSNFRLNREDNLIVNNLPKKEEWIAFDSVYNQLTAKSYLESIEIVNSTGQVVYNGSLDKYGISLGTFPKGIYLIHNRKDGQVERISILK